ncbi:MAG TPA: riboflavin synthase [Mycobacteriales bacterium]|nr:riboflavin synthase [Mycobacteriales bacterium]
MFTGIVEELGEITALEPGETTRLTVLGPLVVSDANEGDSIAVNGVCLTVTGVDRDTFTVDVVDETLSRSSLSAIAVGSRINLERAVTPVTRLGGHLVQGHVDGVGRLLSRGPDHVLRFEMPPALSRYLVEKGSITVDGISLTVVEAGTDSFTVALIPTTLDRTTLGSTPVGGAVNLEVDVVAKYVERLLSGSTATEGNVEV